ncbi:hypothetical protein DMX06_15740 [Pseudomonas mosselii]|nr:hypothetical protein DMX06_15740 [Pseudomonas mosselii]
MASGGGSASSWIEPGAARHVGAALCRERAAKRPQNSGVFVKIAGAAAQPFRDTRPLLQRWH